MDITLSTPDADGVMRGTVTGRPRIPAPPLDATARPFTATSFVARLGEERNGPTIRWVELSGPVATDEGDEYGAAFHFPLLPQQDREDRRFWGKVPDVVTELATLIMRRHTAQTEG